MGERICVCAQGVEARLLPGRIKSGNDMLRLDRREKCTGLKWSRSLLVQARRVVLPAADGALFRVVRGSPNVVTISLRSERTARNRRNHGFGHQASNE